MKGIIYVLIIGFIFFLGCKKEKAAKGDNTIGNTIPYENEQIKLEVINSSLPENIHDILFLNSSKGFAIAYSGKIYKTDDGGQTWVLKYSNDTLPSLFSQLFFTDANVGYAIGESIFKTSDGGETWSMKFPKTDLGFRSISSNTTGDLFVVSGGPYGKIYKSINAGVTLGK